MKIKKEANKSVSASCANEWISVVAQFDCLDTVILSPDVVGTKNLQFDVGHVVSEVIL